MDKSPDAFRTISEVSDFLDTPAHVLRFWESRFPQIRPIKRAGGRRYYRPADVVLLAGIKRLLHDEGVTIRGVQKILREQGVRHVAGLSDSARLTVPETDIEALLATEFGPVSASETEPEPSERRTAQVISLETTLARVDGWTAQLPLDLIPKPSVEKITEAPFLEAEEEPLPEPVRLNSDVESQVPPAADEPTDETHDISLQGIEPVEENTIAARLRQADPVFFAANYEALLVLRTRIINLRARLENGVRHSAK
ncbi:MAG: MerR family transcriptional regulator [Rhodobacteraceae bacterium]|nr:MerR family transcriptional regulator [Paracoccaceae bacterium]